MLRRIDHILALFDPDRHGPRMAAFLFGIALPLLCMALVSVAFNGGVSDTQGRPEQVYFIQ